MYFLTSTDPKNGRSRNDPWLTLGGARFGRVGLEGDAAKIGTYSNWGGGISEALTATYRWTTICVALDATMVVESDDGSVGERGWNFKKEDQDLNLIWNDIWISRPKDIWKWKFGGIKFRFPHTVSLFCCGSRVVRWTVR